MAANPSSYDLYISPYSICSIMVEYTIALRGEPIDDKSEMSVIRHEVDIFHAEQLTEAFLTEINPEGQVCEYILSTSLIAFFQIGLLTGHTFI